ncbi:Very-long-chain aldehyde decarbonylase CER1-like [Theobroma cacao]|nr:Very-long-chain aldehyde decarbonylase CER1-like [Theobroma cacao]
MQYFSKWQRETISKLIGEAIQDADNKGAKVLSLGLLNQVVTLQEDDYKKLLKYDNKLESNLVLSARYDVKVWLVGDGLTDKEQSKAPKGTLFIPFSIFPPNQIRKDCYYHTTPAMEAPKSVENMHSCEDWLPRRVMSASRVAGIIHASEGWEVNECGGTTFSIDKVWEASLEHGFRPLSIST